MTPRASLKARLDRLCETYGASFVESDPVQFPRRYARDDDREVAAFVAAALSYGRVAQIRRNVDAVLSYLGGNPAGRVRTLDPRRAARDLRRFAHRFNTGRDVALLFHILGRLVAESGSLEGAFLGGFAPEHADVGPALSAFCRRALSVDAAPLERSGRVPARAGVRFFFSSPEDGSACKRMNMFLRWMVRRDAVDLGLWRGVPASKLVMPLDTHTARACRRLGLSARRAADWKMAIEVTEALRELDREDPVRYDFALFAWGMSGASRGAA